MIIDTFNRDRIDAAVHDYHRGESTRAWHASSVITARDAQSYHATALRLWPYESEPISGDANAREFGRYGLYRAATKNNVWDAPGVKSN